MTGNFIKNLESGLKKKLPGRLSQNKMAPAAPREYYPAEFTGRAGVLILLFPHHGELSIILIKRTEYPGPHSGQVSLPGGKTEKTDRSQIDTALREAREETGIDTGKVNILGTLTPLYVPVSDTEVLPVVGYTDTQPQFKIDAREVEYLIQIPVKHLARKNLITERKLRIMDQVIKAPGYLIQNEYIWGVTAMILSEFMDIACKAGFPIRE